jgi:hypothetical protein
MISSVPWPDVAPTPWNTVIVDGVSLPGVATVDVQLKEEIDVKKPVGATGATTTYQGRNPMKVVIELFMWESAQLDAWARVFPQLFPAPKKGTAGSRKIVHPKLAIYGIGAVVFESLKDPPNNKGDQYKVTLEAVQFLPPSKSGGTKTKTLEPRQQILAENLTNLPSSSIGP